MPKNHRYKSIEGAIKAIERVKRTASQWRAAFVERTEECKLLAKLSADGPAFFNPLEAMAAKTLRDRKLAEMNMNPDGTFRK